MRVRRGRADADGVRRWLAIWIAGMVLAGSAAAGARSGDDGDRTPLSVGGGADGATTSSTTTTTVAPTTTVPTTAAPSSTPRRSTSTTAAPSAPGLAVDTVTVDQSGAYIVRRDGSGLRQLMSGCAVDRYRTWAGSGAIVAMTELNGPATRISVQGGSTPWTLPPITDRWGRTAPLRGIGSPSPDGSRTALDLRRRHRVRHRAGGPRRTEDPGRRVGRQPRSLVVAQGRDPADRRNGQDAAPGRRRDRPAGLGPEPARVPLAVPAVVTRRPSAGVDRGRHEHEPAARLRPAHEHLTGPPPGGAGLQPRAVGRQRPPGPRRRRHRPRGEAEPPPPRPRVRPPHRHRRGRWMPAVPVDGQVVAYEDRTDYRGIKVATMDGRRTADLVRVPDGFGISPVSWSPDGTWLLFDACARPPRTGGLPVT